MRRFFILIVILISVSLNTFSQELKCNVQLVSQQIQGTNKQVFQTLQNAINEFMNNTVWTNYAFAPNERIECNMLINLTDQASADEFSGTIQIQSRRPVYNSSYNSVLFNYLDNNFDFRYVEYEPLEFDENQHLSNLTSMLAYYAYIIIGLDFDSFSYKGGTEFFEKAEKIVNNAQNAPQKGWKPFDAKSNRNRYWLVKNILDQNYEPVRQFIYNYHRLGLDLMDSKPVEARQEIADSYKLLQKVFRQKPDPFMFFLQVVFDAKSDEWVNVFSEAPMDQKTKVVTILTEIDPANSNKYEKILK
ncbi:MAG TPA: DUF4835 family protein [Bacteroidales bacterium]|nr:DUF4835 family protein [Bacteroidales bacterium]